MGPRSWYSAAVLLDLRSKGFLLKFPEPISAPSFDTSTRLHATAASYMMVIAFPELLPDTHKANALQDTRALHRDMNNTVAAWSDESFSPPTLQYHPATQLV